MKEKTQCARHVVFRSLFAVLFVIAGVAHFVFQKAYVRVVPPLLPGPKLLVVISGIAEIAGGVGILMPRTRRLAAFGLMVLLIAVFPANIYMAIAHVPSTGLLSGKSWLQWLRLPLQIPLIWWAWQYTANLSKKCQAGKSRDISPAYPIQSSNHRPN